MTELNPIPAADRWGPWASAISDTERLARTRCLRTVVALLLGPRGADLAYALERAETDPCRLRTARDCLGRLAALDYRRVLSSYGAVSCPAWKG